MCNGFGRRAFFQYDTLGEVAMTPPLIRSIFLVQLASTLLMVGLIWFVQLVHYPLMARVGEPGFTLYEEEHTRRVTWIVAPLMLAEAFSSALFLRLRPAGVPAVAAWLGLLLLVVVWFSTFALQVPAHQKLVERFDPETVRRLVASNWIRTLAWTARGGLVLWTVSRARS